MIDITMRDPKNRIPGWRKIKERLNIGYPRRVCMYLGLPRETSRPEEEVRRVMIRHGIIYDKTNKGRASERFIPMSKN